MKKVISVFSLIFIFLCLGVVAQANIVEIEEAIINEDYELSKMLAEEVLNFAVVEKTVAHQTSYYLALSQLRLGDYQAATKLFKTLLKKDLIQDLQDKSYLGLFEAYYQQGQYKQAKKIAKKMIKQSKGSSFRSLMYLKLARSHLKLAEWKKAKETLEKIVRVYPESFESYTAEQLLEEKQYFAVQVGAFLERQRALDLAEELKLRTEYAYIVETIDREGRIFYRVRAGQMARLNDAQKLQVNLAEDGYPAQIYP